MQRHPVPPAVGAAATPPGTRRGSGPGAARRRRAPAAPGRSPGARRAPPGRPARPGRRPPTARCPATGRRGCARAARRRPYAVDAGRSPARPAATSAPDSAPLSTEIRRYGQQPALGEPRPARAPADGVLSCGSGPMKPGQRRPEAPAPRPGAARPARGRTARPPSGVAAPGSIHSRASSSGQRRRCTSGTGAAPGRRAASAGRPPRRRRSPPARAPALRQDLAKIECRRRG